MADDLPDNVAKLPVQFKEHAPPERTLMMLHEVPRAFPCAHLYVPYIISESAAEVECGQCHAKLNPIWVLARLANDDRRFAEMRTRYQDEIQRLRERERTKCEWCGNMTRISRR